MKKVKFEVFGGNRLRAVHIMLVVAGLYLLFVTFEVPLLLKSGFGFIAEDNTSSLDGLFRDNSIESDQLGDQRQTFLHPRFEDVLHQSENDNQNKNAPLRPLKESIRALQAKENLPGDNNVKPGRMTVLILEQTNHTQGLSEIQWTAKEAWVMGLKAWKEVEAFAEKGNQIVEPQKVQGKTESCPHSISLTGEQITKSGGIMLLPCGLILGSSITLVGRPRHAHHEYDPKISNLKEGDSSVLVSQFMLELQGLKIVDGEDPPRVLHFNPRLKGDWSGRPVIEQNTCYRMQWASAQRCEGWRSKAEEETVDGLVKCEKWIRDDDEGPKETKTTWWLNRLIGRAKKPEIDWPYPFVEGQLFALTLSAGLEGYHAFVDGRHVASFPYRTGFVLEDATGFAVNGDIDVHSVVATSLPVSNPSFSPQRLLDMSDKWKASPLPESPVDLFVGILSAGNHFAERMAVRKTWMQSELIRSSEVVARFFVALTTRKEVNVQLKKEADFYGDIIIVPFMDSYELVVLKTVAICEYGVHKLSAKYIMKCDDDTFVRVDAVLNEVKRTSNGQGVYIGNLNYYHKPLRTGKWAVTYEEWPEEDYPPYANGPGYVISSNIADFVVSQHRNHKLRLFKMEDVSMGMWVEQFSVSTPVQYSHNWKFCQFGCIEDYYTAHYQSPRQMVCMWDKLSKGKAQCCNMRRR